MPRVINGVDELKSLIGTEVATSEWIEVEQERINQFAEATGDYQWIHLDTDRAKTDTPFGTTIAHGFLTLSLLSMMSGQAVKVAGDFKMGINYGLNKVRFTSPVPSGSKVRGRFVLKEVKEIKGGVQNTWNVTVEREGAEKPCLVAEWLGRAYTEMACRRTAASGSKH